MITGLIGIFARSVVTSQAKVCVKRTLKRVVKGEVNPIFFIPPLGQNTAN